MDRRRTRGRREEVVPPPSQIPAPATKATRSRVSPARKASPSRNRVSPVRRSSRPRSTVLGAPAASPKKELKKEGIKPSPKSRNNLPTTMTTNTSTRAPVKSPTTSSVHSSYSSVTQKTVEIRSSSASGDIVKLGEYLRRSVSKTLGLGDRSHTPTTNTEEAESQYSRSLSRSADSKAEFSDNEKNEDENEHYKSLNATSGSAVAACRKIDAPREFGGWLGALLLMLLTPCVVYYLQWACNKSSCTYRPLNLSALLDVDYLTKRVFTPQPVSAFIAFNLGMFVLSAVMFGRKVNLSSDRSNLEYKFNALPIALILVVAAGVAEFFKYSVADFVLRNYLRFCIFGFLNALIVALWVYLRSDKAFFKQDRLTIAAQQNPYGKTGNFLVDYALGTQLNPKWLGLVDLKMVHYRASLISTLLLAICFLYKTIKVANLPSNVELNAIDIVKFYIINVNYNSATFLAAALLFIYVFDAIVFEHHLASSFELQGEGFGCLLLLRYAATPFLLSGVAKYYSDRQLSISSKYGVLVYISIIVLLAGLILKRFSSAMKYKYRVNPNDPIFQNMPTVHTYQGRRLLLGSFWGNLRQPNYAGDILAMCGLTLPLVLHFSWPPLLGILLLICLLIHRAIRVNARNHSRYHSSWVRYCMQVRYYIVPKIF